MRGRPDASVRRWWAGAVAIQATEHGQPPTLPQGWHIRRNQVLQHSIRAQGHLVGVDVADGASRRVLLQLVLEAEVAPDALRAEAVGALGDHDGGAEKILADLAPQVLVQHLPRRGGAR